MKIVASINEYECIGKRTETSNKIDLQFNLSRSIPELTFFCGFRTIIKFSNINHFYSIPFANGNSFFFWKLVMNRRVSQLRGRKDRHELMFNLQLFFWFVKWATSSLRITQSHILWRKFPRRMFHLHLRLRRRLPVSSSSTQYFYSTFSFST